MFGLCNEMFSGILEKIQPKLPFFHHMAVAAYSGTAVIFVMFTLFKENIVVVTDFSVIMTASYFKHRFKL